MQGLEFIVSCCNKRTKQSLIYGKRPLGILCCTCGSEEKEKMRQVTGEVQDRGAKKAPGMPFWSAARRIWPELRAKSEEGDSAHPCRVRKAQFAFLRMLQSSGAASPAHFFLENSMNSAPPAMVLPGMGTPKESAARSRAYLRSIESNFA